MRNSRLVYIVGATLLAAHVALGADIGTAFTYQGSLENGSGPVTDTCDFQFNLYDAAAGGNLKGTNPQSKPGVTVDAGVFTVNDLDFGASGIDGTARWLEISVCCPSTCAPTLLSPRVKLNPAPHALALPGVFPDTATGNVGIGTNAPIAALHVSTTAAGDTVRFQNSAKGPNQSHVHNGSNGDWFIRSANTNGNVILQDTGGNVGIGENTPTVKLHVNDVLRVADPFDTRHIDLRTTGAALDLNISGADLFIYGGANNVNFFPFAGGGRVTIGTTADVPTAGKLSVAQTAGTVASFNRTTDDGTIIALQQAGSTEGTISVAATTVSYNAFTGSHYAWTDERIERGTLVTLTGVNRSLHDNVDAERIYGIAPTTKANDPQCLGAYLGLLEPGTPQTTENPHQVMAVGNGDMWVVDSGRNIEPGQYLLSSDTKGHAMLDDAGRFPVGYVIARTGEGVDWAKVSEAIDGRKHKRISVFFESFERGSAVRLSKIVEEQQKRIDELSRRLSELEAAKPTQSSLATAGIVCFGLGAMTFGGRAPRRRSVRGGVR